MHFCTPCDGRCGFHSSPFSCTVLATLQPPCDKISSTDLIVPRFDPSSPINSGSCAFFSAGDFFTWKYYCIKFLFIVFRCSEKSFSCLRTSGHTRQHAVLFGRYATLSAHASAGHWTRGHLISNVLALHVQIAHRSNPFGGKYGYQDDPAEWNWSPNRQPRGIFNVFSTSFDAAKQKQMQNEKNRQNEQRIRQLTKHLQVQVGQHSSLRANGVSPSLHFNGGHSTLYNNRKEALQSF